MIYRFGIVLRGAARRPPIGSQVGTSTITKKRPKKKKEKRKDEEENKQKRRGKKRENYHLRRKLNYTRT